MTCFFSLKDDSDDDLNDEDIPSFGAGTPLLPPQDKGKGRSPQSSDSHPPPAVSGNINSPGNAPRSSARQSFGGVQLETRYAPTLSHLKRVFSSLPEAPFPSYGGIDTLDEPVTVTIVCPPVEMLWESFGGMPD